MSNGLKNSGEFDPRKYPLQVEAPSHCLPYPYIPHHEVIQHVSGIREGNSRRNTKINTGPIGSLSIDE